MPLKVSKDDFARAIVEENVLEKPTQSSRKKSLRHLVELYGMDPSQVLFRVLWEFGHADLDSLAQLCLVCVYKRGDPVGDRGFPLSDVCCENIQKYTAGCSNVQWHRLHLKTGG